MAARGNPNHAPREVVVEAKALSALVEQANEPARDVAEADQQGIDNHLRLQHVLQPRQPLAKCGHVQPEPDPEEPVHAEMVARHNQDAFLLAELMTSAVEFTGVW